MLSECEKLGFKYRLQKYDDLIVDCSALQNQRKANYKKTDENMLNFVKLEIEG